jgi:sarcosine oxidase
VVERDPTYANGSTGRSIGGIRQQFSVPENIRLSLFGAEFVKEAPAHLAVEGEMPELGFKEQGYLFLASAEGLDALRENHALQVSEGAAIDAYDAEGLADRFPWLNAGDLAGGCFGAANEGWLDPYGLLQAFRKKARSLGATYLEDDVTGLERAGGRIAAVETASGARIACGQVVNAAGAAAGRVAAMAGIELPVVPKKRLVFAFDCREAPAGPLPLTVDPSGVYFRPEGAQFLCGKSPEPEDDPECWDFEIDYDLFEEVLWPALAHRVPAFEAIKMAGAWAGHYEVNLLDDNAVIGPHPEVSNLFFVNGFSGHGLQQAPGAGRAIAELILTGGFRTIDLSRFGYARVAAKAPVLERGIV